MKETNVSTEIIDRIIADISFLHESDRCFTSKATAETCRRVEKLMRDAGFEDVITYKIPADGKTSYGGWLAPVSWDVEEAVLAEVSSDGQEKIFRRYTEEPCSLMLYSRSANKKAFLALPEEKDLTGKIVLNDRTFPNMRQALRWQENGACGVISSVLGCDYHKDGHEYLRDACQWLNFVMPHWNKEGDMFGFSITPAQGEEFRNRLENGEKILLHADVKSSVHDQGFIPLLTGILRGESSEEIAVGGHLFEYGANDNASGPMTVLAILRQFKEKNIKPKRSFRFYCCYEVRAMQALLNSGKELVNVENILAGVDVDMVGKTFDKVVRTGGSRPFNPTFADVLMNNIVEKHGYIVHRAQVDFSPMDNLLCEPGSGGVPYTNFMMVDGEPDYHKSTDTPERLRREDLEKSYAMLEEYLMTLCNAESETACQIADEVEKDCMKRLAEADPDKRARVLEESFTALDSTFRMVRFASENEKNRVRKWIEKRKEELRRSYEKMDRKEFVCSTDFLGKDVDLIPEKTVRGCFSTEKYMPELSRVPEKLLPEIHGWSASSWLVHFFYFMNGKYSLGELYTLLQISNFPVKEDIFREMVFFLEKDGMIRFKSCSDIAEVPRKNLSGSSVSNAEISVQCFDMERKEIKTANLEKPIFTSGKIFEDALKQLGVFPGIRMVVHSSLSSFGDFEGGAKNLCRILCKMVSEDGTLMMPGLVKYPADGEAFVYDPDKTPVSTGIISETFRHLPGVVRSWHPTHSFCVWGKDKIKFVSKHHMLPAMHERSPLGLLEKAEGYCLLLGCWPVTFMHIVEASCGAACCGDRTEEYPGIIHGKKVKLRGWAWRNGKCRGFRQDEIFEFLREHHLLSELMLGRSHLRLFKLSDYRKAYSRLLLDPVSGCKGCLVCPRKVKQTVESDWDTEMDQLKPTDAFTGDYFLK